MTETERDPFVAPVASPRGAAAVAWAAIACALLAVPTGLAVVLGPLGMVGGTVAYLKGSRLGMPAAVLSGVALIAGMAIQMFLR